MSLTVNSNHKLSEELLQTAAFDKFIAEYFQQLTGHKYDKEHLPENVDVSINLRDLHAFFREMQVKNIESVAKNDQQIRELTLQLESIRHAHASLEAEFQSKFEKDKSLLLQIPGTKPSHLKPMEEDDDSAKSFRPDEEDTKADVDRKLLERKMEKLQEKVEGQAKQMKELEGGIHQEPKEQHYHQHRPGKCPCHVNGHNHNHLYTDTHQNLPGL